MRIRDLILTIFVVSLLINSAIIVYYASGKLGGLSDATSVASSQQLTADANENLLSITIGVRDQLDNRLDDQYTLVKTWATTPTLLSTAKQAQSFTKEQLYEMWSAEKTRVYDEGEATGDGDPANDLSPETSNYLASLSQVTGTFPEVFITDNRGYAIAASVATGDFDQGPDDWRVFLDDAGKPYYKMFKPQVGGEGWYKNANAAVGGFWVSDVIFDESSKTWGLEIISQLRDPTTGEYLGQLKAVFDFSAFVANIVNLQETDVDSVGVVTKDGKYVAFYEGSAGTKEGETLAAASDTFTAEMTKELPSGTFIDRDAKGTEIISAYVRSADKNQYVIVVSRELADVRGPIDAFSAEIKAGIDDASAGLQSSILLIAAIIGLATLIIAYLFINAKIVRPLAKMSEAADKLSDGNFDIELPEIKTGNELQKFSALTALLVSIIKQSRTKPAEKKPEEKKKK